MKKYLFSLVFAFMSTFAMSQGLDGIVVEKFYVSNAADGAGSIGTLPTGSVTWRFYVDLAPGWELQAVYGDGNHNLKFETTTTFFNNEDRGAKTANGINFNYVDDNTVMLDSYISVGGTCSNRLGVLKSEDDGVATIVNTDGILQNNDPSAGIPISTQDGQTSASSTIDAVTAVNIDTDLDVFDAISQAGSLFQTMNGSWANLNGSEGVTPSNMVLIAQITTEGVLTYELNVQIRNTTTLQIENYVASNPVGSELTMPSLSGTLNVANALPTATVTAPAGGSTYLVGATVTIDATASDPDGTVTNVEFLVDGSVVGSDATAPYTFDWTATVGTHNITARATDDLGGQGTSAPVNIIVGNVIPPTVSITSPANGATYVLGDVATIDATAADADGTVTNVEFFVNGSSIGSDATAPYSVNWPVVVGNAVLTAVATDNDNATTTSAPVNISVFDSSSAYVIVSETAPCSNNSFCLPINAITPVDDVIGYDLTVQYDNTKVDPTGVIVVAGDLITPGYTSIASSIDDVNGLMYISVFFNASAPSNAEFNGTGTLLCVEFVRTTGFAANDVASFSVPSLQESYFNGVLPKVVSPGDYSTFQESDFSSRLKFWFDNSPIRYNAAVPGDYLITNIYGDDATCSNLSATAVQPDLNGEFTYDYSNGTNINIQKDIAGATSVQPVVNGFDAFLTRRVLVNDATFIPSVYQIISMDVNTDGVISAGDLSQINQRAVLIIDEFRQDWNYNAQGVSNGEPSKDWLFIDGSTLSSNPGYQASANYPFPDGVGFDKSNVPQIDFCLEVPVFSNGSCQTFALEQYTGMLLGDVNGNYATVTPNNEFRLSSSDKVVLDLTKAVVAGNKVEVPVYTTSLDEVNSLDFAFGFNTSKLSFSSATAENANIESVSHFNAADSKLRFTSYSLDNYDLSSKVATVTFETNGTEIVKSDIHETEAYINGELVMLEVIGSRVGSSDDVMLSVFPNPAKDVVNILTSEDASFELMNFEGKTVVAETTVNAFEQYALNTQNLANGVYMLKVYNNNTVTVNKIVINK